MECILCCFLTHDFMVKTHRAENFINIKKCMWNGMYYIVFGHMMFMVKHISCHLEIHLQSRMISTCISGYFSRIPDNFPKLSDMS